MDFIDLFMEYTEGIPAPEMFRLFAGISTIAGAMERRVGVRLSGGILFPNLFLMLIAPPAVGKSQAISRTRDLWYETKKFNVAPNSVSKSGLLDRLVGSTKKVPNGDRLLEYSFVNVASTEFGTLVPAYDLEFLAVLIELYDCLPEYREERRDKSRSVTIPKPGLNLLAGSQPGFLASLLPEEAWNMGFMSRVLMVYSSSSPPGDIFQIREERDELFKPLVGKLKALSNLAGNVKLEREFVEEFSKWGKAGFPPVPQHSKLQYYNSRRELMMIKLSMISSFSRSEDCVVRIGDFHRAKAWLLAAENQMPEVFRDMVQKSDAQLIQDLHHYLWRLWVKENREPLHESRLYTFLKTKTVAERIPRIIDIAVRSGVVGQQSINDKPYFIPKPTNEHGLE